MLLRTVEDCRKIEAHRLCYKFGWRLDTCCRRPPETGDMKPVEITAAIPFYKSVLPVWTAGWGTKHISL